LEANSSEPAENRSANRMAQVKLRIKNAALTTRKVGTDGVSQISLGDCFT